MAIDRRPLRDLIVADILKRLQAGYLPVRTRVDELALAAELEVSRTPVREALSLLAYEGILEMRMGKGFWVLPLSAKDIEEAYPVIVALESQALKSIPASDLKEVATRLHAAADGMERVAPFPSEAQEADETWHQILVAAAGNRRLEVTLTRVKQSVRRAEYQLMRNPDVVRRSISQHRAIASALAEGDASAAAELLDRNWGDGMREMLKNFGSGQEALGELPAAKMTTAARS